MGRHVYESVFIKVCYILSCVKTFMSVYEMIEEQCRSHRVSRHVHVHHFIPDADILVFSGCLEHKPVGRCVVEYPHMYRHVKSASVLVDKRYHCILPRTFHMACLSYGKVIFFHSGTSCRLAETDILSYKSLVGIQGH